MWHEQNSVKVFCKQNNFDEIIEKTQASLVVMHQMFGLKSVKASPPPQKKKVFLISVFLMVRIKRNSLQI